MLMVIASVLTLGTLALIMPALVAVVADASLITRSVEAFVSLWTQLAALDTGADAVIHVVIGCLVGILLARLFSVLLHTRHMADRK